MLDLEKLLAAIDEREKIARECGDKDDRRWKWSLLSETVRTESGDYVACGPWDCDVSSNHALHMVHNDPNVVIRHCKADRATVVQYELLLARKDYAPGLGETLAVLRAVIERLAAAYGISVEEETTGE